jgi:UDP:flavonoid glycosyltransferase YjiC (YdhE family)
MRAALSADLYLAPVPPEFVTRPADWPSNAQLAGFCPGNLPGSVVPTEVNAFLAAGDPPVLITVGSAPSSSSGARLAEFAETLDGMGVRSLILVGRDELREGLLRDRAGVAVFAPLAAVLPRCRAIIHHGGYGTTAAALLAGVPSVVTPFMPDQLWYGRCIEAIGAGVVVPARRSRRGLHAAVEKALHEVALGEHARRIADTLQASDGVDVTVDALEAALVP